MIPITSSRGYGEFLSVVFFVILEIAGGISIIIIRRRRISVVIVCGRRPQSRVISFYVGHWWQDCRSTRFFPFVDILSIDMARTSA